MGIDTSMYGRNQGVDVMGSIQRGLTVRDMIDQRKMRGQEQEKAKAIKQVYASNMGQDGQLDRQGALSQLYKIDPQAAMAQEQQFGQMDKAKRVDAADNLEQQFKEMKMLAGFAGSATDQQSYDGVKAQAGQIGFDVSGMPQQFDPNLMKQYQLQALTTAERLDSEIKQRQMGQGDRRMEQDDRRIGQQDRQLGQKEREFEFKKQEVTAPGSSFGKPPPGYRFLGDGSLEAIPGGPAAGKTEMQQAKAERQQDLLARDAGVIVDDLDLAMEVIDSGGAAGAYVGKTKHIPGTRADRLEDIFATVKANLGFEKLQAMRAASPTGGALGAVSDKENAMLQDAAGMLKPDMNEKDLKRNIARLLEKYNEVIHGPDGGGTERSFSNENRSSSGDQAQASQQSQPKTVVQNGHTYTLNEATGEYE